MQQSIDNLRHPKIENNEIIEINPKIENKIEINPKPIYSEYDKKKVIIDCGYNYYVTTNNDVFREESPHEYVGRYIHDDNCPCRTEKKSRRFECWYYLEYLDDIKDIMSTSI